MKSIIATAILILATNNTFAKEHIVKVISDYEKMRMYFSPTTLTIEPGDTVIWENQQKDRHNVATYPDGYPAEAEGFESPFLNQKGDTFKHSFIKPGTYQYHCYPHVLMGMRGEIIVGKASTDAEMHIPTLEEVDIYKSKMLKIFEPDEYNYAPKYIREKIDSTKPIIQKK